MTVFVNCFHSNAQTHSKYKDQALVFFSIECPICEKYTKILQDISAETHQKIVLVYTDKTIDNQSITKFHIAYKIDFDFITDYKRKLQKKLKASISPEVFLFDGQGKIVYQGAIDDWYFELGKNRPQATKHFLKDAILATQNHKIPQIKKTQAVGCYL